jgi:hypothetical protein
LAIFWRARRFELGEQLLGGFAVEDGRGSIGRARFTALLIALLN